MNLDTKDYLRIAILALACILLGVTLIVTNGRKIKTSPKDFKYRYNEIVCAHEGIDPFDIFERKKDSEVFCSIPRPDKPQVDRNGRKPVHAYPAWHTAAFWWYGFVPQNVCIAIMACLNFFSFAWVIFWIRKTRKKDKTNISSAEFFLFLLGMTLYPFFDLIISMNYGMLILGCTLLLCTALEQKHDVLAGIIFSFIMIKPQIGVLLLIPLFINRNYKTVVIAGAICLLETMFTAWKLDKSLIEMILQIPQIGAPFPKGFFAEIAIKVFGSFGQYISMGAFAGLAVAGCFLVRDAKEIWIRFLPAIVFVPFWTYSQKHDWLVLLPVYFYLLDNRQKHQRLYSLCFCLLILRIVVSFFWLTNWYYLGKQGLAAVLHLGIVSITCFIVILDNNKKWNDKYLELKHKYGLLNK